jgi:hypothetical protein
MISFTPKNAIKITNAQPNSKIEIKDTTQSFSNGIYYIRVMHIVSKTSKTTTHRHTHTQKKCEEN